MGRMYSLTSSGALTTAADLIEINAPSTAAVFLHAVYISQSSDTDSEQLRVTIQRSTGTSGSGGAAITARPLWLGDTAFAGTVEALNTTRATTLTLLHSEAFNVLAGWVYMPTPETRWGIRPSGRLIVGLETTPADSLTFEVTAYFEALG